MTTLDRPVRRVTQDTYGYGRNARKLVVTLQKGDLITIREQGRRTSHTARLYDVFWRMLCCEADKARMGKLRERKAHKTQRLAERRQLAAERRLFRNNGHAKEAQP
ncbi:MAG: hypothetical protein L0Z50_40925 [Verrucomicrobiales bacterium]|nr:hypothetical protein [Verrucomicrobiales bacterium]